MTASIAPHGATVTRLDQLLGAPDNMSLAQAQGSADLDTRSDIYRFGVLLYELLCGRTPFALFENRGAPGLAFEGINEHG